MHSVDFDCSPGNFCLRKECYFLSFKVSTTIFKPRDRCEELKHAELSVVFSQMARGSCKWTGLSTIGFFQRCIAMNVLLGQGFCPWVVNKTYVVNLALPPQDLPQIITWPY